MQTTQDKFTALMESVAQEHGLDLITDRSYANIGQMAFQRTDSFSPVLAFSFNFQSGYASFHGGIGEWHYVTPAKTARYPGLDEVVQAVRDSLTDSRASIL